MQVVGLNASFDLDRARRLHFPRRFARLRDLEERAEEEGELRLLPQEVLSSLHWCPSSVDPLATPTARDAACLTASFRAKFEVLELQRGVSPPRASLSPFLSQGESRLRPSRRSSNPNSRRSASCALAGSLRRV